jgi:hypothetical protein
MQPFDDGVPINVMTKIKSHRRISSRARFGPIVAATRFFAPDAAHKALCRNALSATHAEKDACNKSSSMAAASFGRSSSSVVACVSGVTHDFRYVTPTRRRSMT